MKRRDLRILWSSNAPHTNSGYAVETRDLLFRFLKDGWPTACIGFWGVQGHKVDLLGEDLIDDRFKGLKLPVYPGMESPWGSDALIGHTMNYNANVVFTMQDIWSLEDQHLSKIKYWIPFLPIDKDPAPPGVLAKLKYAYRIVTFSEFGRRTLQKAGFTSTMIYEGVDTHLFNPLDKQKCREELQIPQDAFVFGMVAANKENPPRKGFQEALESFKMFNDIHPEAMLIIHTQQPSPQGFPVFSYAEHLGIRNKVRMVDFYQAVWNSDFKTINKEMNSFDVLLHPSQTEGFGLTIVEAQSAGIPVLINDCHSMPELIIEGKTGFKCKTERPRWSNDNSFVIPADPQSLYEQMENIYNLIKKNPNKVKNDCRKHVKESFDLDLIYENKWNPFLEKLQDEILPIPTVLTPEAKKE